MPLPCSPVPHSSLPASSLAFPGYGDVSSEVARLAERAKEKPERLRRDLERRGVLEAVRSEIARGKALEFLVEHASIVNEAGDAIDLTLPEQESKSTDNPSAVEESPEA